MNDKGVQSIGIRLPIVKQGDNLVKIVCDYVIDSMTEYSDDIYGDDKYIHIDDRDVIGITESIVARTQGNYVTIDEIVKDLEQKGVKRNLVLYSPIMSRNRFSMILKAFARFADNITILYNGKFDEQGNPNWGINQFTGVNIKKYYEEICVNEACSFKMLGIAERQITRDEYRAHYMFDNKWITIDSSIETLIDCRCHPDDKNDCLTLKDIMNKPIESSGYNSKYGLLGSNKATEEKIKLFPEPELAQKFVVSVQKEIFSRTGKHVEVMIYGDGCFKDPIGGIWEWADPVTTPAYTEGLNGTPNEIKIKAFADDKFKDLTGSELTEAVKSEIRNKESNLVGNMASQGTTPRRYVDLLASLMDLTSGSGDKGTPVVLVKNYFKKYSD